MSLFVYLFTLRSICGTGNSSQQMSLQCLLTVSMVFSDKDKILIKKNLYLKGYTKNTGKRLTDEFPEKSWRKRGVNKLLKSCGTQAQLTGGQAPADLAVPALNKCQDRL